ncbi:hypothetical protein LOTGIDRAFT_230052 [Lottia gigantea]|uniref:DUF1330 domain-containing protein n=1 Tax=Lottia gigantea TaxID=225164 RepID=V4CRA0_LOTGI|nr:hypothetical protein LOTGIDRAFT_230052 [Lottia gigantea]ESP05015.1 hypothetical protein LOTGIDRAFT_230052 [Lottia gigantea]
MAHYYTPNEEHGAYLFARFPSRGGTDVAVVSQSCVLNKKSAEIQRGRFLGIARKIYGKYTHGDHATPRYAKVNQYEPEMALIVYLFENQKYARLFFNSDKRFKQPDFPPPSGMCEAWSVCRYYTPDYRDDNRTFMMSEVQLQEGVRQEEYRERYCTPFAQLLLDYDAHPYVVQANTVEDLRRYYLGADTILTVHVFPTPEELWKCIEDDRYIPLKAVHATMASENLSVFTIDPKPCR